MSDSIRILNKPVTDSPEIIPHRGRETVLATRSDSSISISAELATRVLLRRIAHDPFVGYVGETGENYVITSRDGRSFTIPKGYPARELYPPPRQTQAEHMMGMLAWMAFGLVPAGFGALVLCPFVLREAFYVAQNTPFRRERRQAFFAGGAALGLGIVAEVFVLLFILHLIG